MELIELERKAKENGEKFNRVIRLKEELGKVSDNFDYILIDCPPSLGILTTNALAAANSVLIPVQCEYFALEGIMQLINTIMLAQRKVNPNLDIEGVLLTMFSNTNLGIEVIESIKGSLKKEYIILLFLDLLGWLKLQAMVNRFLNMNLEIKVLLLILI